MTRPAGPPGTPLSGSSAGEPVPISGSRGQALGRGLRGPEPQRSALVHPGSPAGAGPSCGSGSGRHAPRAPWCQLARAGVHVTRGGAEWAGGREGSRRRDLRRR